MIETPIISMISSKINEATRPRKNEIISEMYSLAVLALDSNTHFLLVKNANNTLAIQAINVFQNTSMFGNRR